MNEKQPRSRAWQLGWDAGREGSSRKPPKGASESWKAEFEAGRTAAREDYRRQRQSWGFATKEAEAVDV